MVPSSTPKRDHGDPQSFGCEARAKGMYWCGRRDLNPHGPCGPTDFRTLLRLSPPPTAFAMGLGVWTIPSPFPNLAPGVRCCPSSLYTFPAVSGRAWLGIAMLQGSPTLSSSASPVSRRALKFALKSDASADSATPAWLVLFYPCCSLEARSSLLSDALDTAEVLHGSAESLL